MESIAEFYRAISEVAQSPDLTAGVQMSYVELAWELSKIAEHQQKGAPFSLKNAQKIAVSLAVGQHQDNEVLEEFLKTYGSKRFLRHH